MRIESLREHPRLLPSVAEAQVAAFGALLPGWTVEEARLELARQRFDDRVPLTLVALNADGSDWLGTVGLLHEDHGDIRQYSPWLASLLVRQEGRGRGLGAALVAACVAEAARHAIPVLYLYCLPPLEAFYARLGWRVENRLQIGPMETVIMAIDTHRNGLLDAEA